MFISTRSVCAFALGAALLLGAGEVSAQGGGGGRGGGGRGGAPMTPMAYRQGIMQQFQANVGALNAARQGQAGAANHVLLRAEIIQRLTQMLLDAFPEGSAGEGSRALPAIWTNTADFQARIQAIQAAADGLVNAARGGNADQVQAAVMTLQQGCGACHMAFRGPAPGN